MKDFLKYLLATVIGIAVMGFLGMFLFVATIIGLAAAGSDQPQPIVDKNVLKISLSGTVAEKAEDNPLAVFLGNEEKVQSLKDLKHAIRVAKEEKNIKGIFLECGALSAQPATLEELRKELDDFRASGKFVMAYADQYTQGAYYVASVADRVYLNPSGMIDWHGITAEPLFFKDLMDKVGVQMQIFRVGTFKSAVEPYMLSGMSAANRKMTEEMIGSLWTTMRGQVAASRGVSEAALQTYADEYITFAPATKYKEANMVDSLVYVDEVRDELNRYLGEKTVKFAGVADAAMNYKEAKSDEVIAVYMAEGEIVDAPSPGKMSGSQIVGSQLVEDLDRLAHDEQIKAVVLRVNSPGGSAYASEQMWRAVQLLKKKKPVVVSMGGMAASGGYYLSCGADFIVADSMTLTGSIGIFGMIPNFTNIAENKLGVHSSQVTTNSTPPMMNAFGGMSKPGAAMMQRNVERGYELFLKRVAEGRGMTRDEVDHVAQGRVWTGEQALGIHLVDSLGGLDMALAKAGALAEIADYKVVYDARKMGFLQQLLDEVKGSYFEREIKTQLGDWYAPLEYMREVKDKNQLQARLPMFLNLKN